MWKLVIIFSFFLVIGCSKYPSLYQPCDLLKEVYSTSKDRRFEKKKLEEIIKYGTYAFIESDTNQKQNLPEETRYKNFCVLRKLLTNYGFPNRQVIGCYDNVVTKFSYLVLNKNPRNIKKFRRIMFSLGKQFKQESIILASNGKVQLVFTSGPNIGRAYMGEGFNEITDKNYSVIKCDCPNQTNYCKIEEKCLVIGQYYLNRTKLSYILAEFKDLL